MPTRRPGRHRIHQHSRHAQASNLPRIVLLCIGIVLVLALVATWIAFSTFGNSGNNRAGEASDKSQHQAFDYPADQDARQVTFKDDRRTKYQDLTEQQLAKDYAKEPYSIDDPFVVVDPYDNMPLSALMMFKTKEPAQITVTVESEGDADDITRTYKGYKKEHRVPVLGLYEDSDNAVQVEAKTKGKKANLESTVEVTTEPFPDDFLRPELVTSDPEAMEAGLSFMIPTKEYMYAADANADVRWFTSLPAKLAFERLENGHILFASREENEEQYNELIEMDMLGKIYNDYVIQIDGYDDVNLIHHDVVELPNGNLLATTHEPDSDYIEDQMIEIDRKTGQTRRFINNRDLFDAKAYEEYSGKNADTNDWLHQNAIWLDDESDSIYISGRSQDSIVKMSYPDAEIDWILGAHEDWPESHDEYLLDPVGDVKFPAGQHAVKKLPDQDGDPNTVDIILFDNNTVLTRGDEEASDTYSRGVQYRIDEKKRTVEEVWAYGEDRGTAFFSDIIGNTQYLPDTDQILITSGAIDVGEEGRAESRVVEVTRDDDPKVVFEVKNPAFYRSDARYIYRSFRWPLYPDKKWDFSFGPQHDSGSEKAASASQ
jgi:arylsulfate sulfotransferase